ncbi:MAG: carboxypeptidase regulatory-like domain-containing protein [Candidatus Cloacimonetes bacterium]|nr:carboxypeptidase regulatory-like domain-containing protein [Candidatus Cloacimonadota bacterium]
MKKFILLLIALLLTSSLAFGAYIEIGDGTGYQNYVPCYGYYNYSWSQTIYLQSEIGMAVDITGIHYDVNNTPAAYAMENQEVYIGHTTLTEFPSNENVDPVALGMTSVWSGTMTWNGSGWQGIDFTAPFSYNGTDNLMIVWINYRGDYSTGYPNFKYTNHTDRVVRDYDDYVPPGPGHTTGYLSYYVANIRLLADIPYGLNVTQLTPDANILMGQTFDYLMKVCNLGDNADTYDLTLAGGAWTYEIRDKDDTGVISTISIGSGECDTVIVRVTAPAAKDVTDMTTFTATSQADPTVSASDDINTTAYEPYLDLFENFDTCTAPDLPPKWSRIVQTTSTYPYVDTYSSATYAYSGLMSVKMYNSSDTAAELMLVTPALQTGVWGNVISAMVRSSSGTQNILVGTLTDPSDPSTFSLVQSFEVTSTYSEVICPIDFAKATGYVAFKHGQDGTYDYFYIDDVAWQEIIPEPDMIIDETAHDFGMVDQGTVETWDVTIYNDGFGTLYFNGVTINPPFSVTYPDSIEPLSYDVATVELDATTVGMFADVLEFHTNAVQDSTIDLSVIVKGVDYAMEGFEETTFPPFGWENPGDYWARFMSDAYEGQGFARCSWYHDYDAVLITPRLVINGGDFIDFFWRNDNLYEAKGADILDGDTLFVEISNTYLNQNPTWECIAVLTADAPMDDYEEVFVTIPDTYIGENAKIRFRHRSELNSESRGVGIDNIIMPEPYLPINFSVDPYYASDYIAAGNNIQYEFDVTNMGIQSDRYIFVVQDSSAIRYNKRDVEDFETSDGGWVATADWDPVGDWAWTNTYDVANYTGTHTPPPAAHSGTGLWATVPEGDYTNSGGNTYMSKTVDFSSVTGAYLQFWYWSDIFGSWDYCDVIVNGDILLTVDSYPGTAWEFADLDLSAYDGMSDVQIVFSFYATTVVEYAGMYIDDLDYPGGGGPGPGPGPTGWPVTVSPPYIELDPGEVGNFTVTVAIPEDAALDACQLTPVLAYSREESAVQHQVLVLATAHPRDPYEPNDLMVDATPAHFDFVSEGAQIYYNPDYRDKDIDIYTIDCLEGDIVWCAFELPIDETEFDGAIKLVDADSTELAYADSWAGGGSEYLQYRILEDGTYYWILGKWDNVLLGKDSKKTVTRGVNTTYYTVAFDLIPSPEVAVEPASLTLGLIAGTGGTVSDELYISNIAPDAMAEDLSFNIETVIPGVETLYESDFGDFSSWTITGGTNWGESNTSYAGGTPPEARFYWSPSTTALQRLISPVINTTGYTSANLTFKHFLDYYSTGITVGVATTSDGGATWNTVWSTSPTANMGPETVPVTIDNADMGSDQFQMCWFFDGYSFNIDYWYVDDVNLGVGSEWISVSPVTGTVGQGNTKTITVTCDGDARLDPGMYTADLIVHNDALLYGASDITVPVVFYISDAAGGLQGTVTFNGDPVPDVMVKAGNFVTYTDEYGFYCFTEVASGFFDIYFYKDGFQPYWAYGVYLNPGWIVLLDVEMIFDGPVPENLSATGIQEAVDIDWDKPQTGGGGGGTQVDYVLDDGTYENGWSINPGYEAWLGNLFQTDDGGEIISFELYGDANAAAGGETVTIDIYDEDRNLIGTTDPFVIPADDWVTVPVPNVSFAGDFYAMVHWNMNTSSTNYVGFDENGPNANANLDWYMSGGAWQLLHVAAASTPGVFGIRATAMVRGRNIELAYNEKQLGKEPEVNLYAFDATTIDNGKRILDKVFAQSGHTVDTGNYEVSHYTFNGNTELGFKMPRDITLLGYNVYELGKGFVAYVDGENHTNYTDDIVAVGEEYTYWVTAVYEEGESGPSNTDTAVPLAPSGGYHEPFDVDWHNTGWTTQGSPNNWLWSAGYAYLYWSPSVTNYDMSLVSPVINLPANPLDVYDIKISMYINDYSTDSGEIMEIWVVHPGGEDLIFEWDLDTNDDWGVSGGTDWFYDDTAQYAGQDVQLKFRSHGGTTYNFNYWYVYDVLWDYAGIPPVYGALEGTVTDGDGNPLEGVAVTANPSDYNPVYTDEFGYYLIDPMAVGFYDVQYYKAGYTEIWYYDVEIEENVTTVLDVALGNPTMDITPTSINATVPVGGTSTRTITVTNNGNAPLDWSASIENQTELRAKMLENSYTGQTAPSFIAEADPNPDTYNPPASDDMWDILFNWDVDTPTGGVGVAGAGCGNNYVLASEWGYSSRNVFKFDFEGNYIGSWVPTWMPGTAGLRDMAFDGEYFYASNAGNTIYQFDADGNNYGTISSPVAVRSIAYDDINDAFWVNNWSETLTLISRTGTILNTIASPPSMYGSAYDNVTAGGPYLWIFTGTTTGGGCQIEQYNLNTLTLTGVTHSVDGDFGVGSYIAGGLFATGNMVPGTWVLGGCAQGTPDLLFGYELGPFASWITMDPTSGTVLPYGAYEEVTVTFDACDDPAGTIHTCDITFDSPQGVPSVTIPVTLMVGNPEYGELAGTVTAATGGAPIAGAQITASDDADNTYVTYTNASGQYTIEDMMVGYYTVECIADGYNYHVETDVPIVVDQTTTQNFALTAPVMVVNPTVINVNVPPGSTHTEYITVQNTGDGPMDFNVNLYDYGKLLTAPTDYSRFNCEDELLSIKNEPVTGTTSFNATQTRDDVTIQYQTGYDDNGIGTGGVFDAICAARFTSTELAPYYDTYNLTQVNIHVRSADFTSVELKVFEGGSYGNAGTEVYSQDITASVLIDQWTNVVLTTPVPILSGNEYWLGYSISATADHPCSVDAGPMATDKGAWMYYSGAWSLLTDLNPALDYNWCIQGILSLGTPPWITVDPTFGTIAPSGQTQIAVMFDATDLTYGEIKTADIEILSDPDVGSVTVPVTLTATDTVSNGDVPVTETKLYANYPNPMLHTTTFQFSLRERSHVKLSIYNLKGQLVETIVDTEFDPAPKHSVEWNGTANGKTLANGIYFYKLEADNKTFLKKMILMK